MNGKFRVWDEETKEFVDENYLTQFFFDKNGDLVIICMEEGYENAMLATDNFIPTFFTGLQDKNGNYIYKGDIIKAIMRAHDEDIIFQGEVYYKFGCPLLNDRPFYMYNEFEIIGNIFENGDLLK